MDTDLVRRLEIMVELSEWDGNTGRAARMALQIVRDLQEVMRSEFYAERGATPPELHKVLGDKSDSTRSPHDIVFHRCRGCGEDTRVSWRFGNGGSASAGPSNHIEGCLVPRLESLLWKLP